MKHTDLTYLKEISNGSDTFITEMLTIYLKEMPDALSRIEMHLQNKDWKLLHAVLHKIKPSISFVGLKEIEGILREAEEYAATETNLDKLPDMIVKIIAISNEAMKELREELK